MSRAKQIIQAFFQRRQRPEVTRRFAEWLEHPIDRDRKESLLRAQWDSMPVDADPEARERSWQAVERRIHAGVSRKKVLWRRRVAVVAAVVVPLAILLAVYVRVHDRSRFEERFEMPQFVERVTPYGRTERVVLPDSTVVMLNAGSVLIYPERFCGQTREVHLSGEASFRVRSDARHPFIVRTADLRTEVLGTVFNVSAYADDSFTEVTLCEGRVRVGGRSSEEFTLRPGEQLCYDRQSRVYSRREVSADEIVSWEKGALVFQRDGIHAIIRALERRYGITIYLSSERYDRDLLTLRIPAECTADEAIRLIAQLIPGLHFRFDKKNVYLD